MSDRRRDRLTALDITVALLIVAVMVVMTVCLDNHGPEGMGLGRG